MADYSLVFDYLDGDRGLIPRTVSGDTAAELAQDVHRHARGYMGSRRVDIHLDEATLAGTITNHGAVVGTFHLALTQLPSQYATQPLHGYTAADIDNLARKTLAVDRWHAGDIEERRAAVRFAIVEYLCTAGEQPTPRDLVTVGLRASDRHVTRELHHHGWDIDDLSAGAGAMVGFQRYWQASPSGSPERRIVEREALNQIWSQLTPRQQQALNTLAAAGDYAAAATALGIADGTFRVLISQARRRYLTWWHEGEQPSRTWRTDRHSYSRDGLWRGRRRLTVSEVNQLRARFHEGEKLAALASEAAVHKSTLSSLLSGRTKPAPDSAGGVAA